MRMRLLRAALTGLSVMAVCLTAIGLLAAAAVKSEPFDEMLLSYYPRYAAAIDDVRTLQEFKNSAREADKDVPVGVVSITDPAWPVLLAFIQSEVAIRKSARSEPPGPPATGSAPATAPADQGKPAPSGPPAGTASAPPTPSPPGSRPIPPELS